MDKPTGKDILLPFSGALKFFKEKENIYWCCVKWHHSSSCAECVPKAAQMPKLANPARME